VIGGLLVGWAFRAPETTGVAVIGSPAPDFTVSLIDGGSFTLSDHLDDEDLPVLVNLWASWCIPCRTETPEISAFAQAHPEVKVIGVSVEDTEDGAREFADQFAPAYDLAFGDRSFEEAYPRLGLPATYLIGADGVVEDLFNGIVTQQVLEDFVAG
jgi:cytochrome c biogenesis protein CcmG/thiol:disulfide interchange protein DsbE